MSEEILSVVITALVIALMFAWVPVLEFVCPRCSRAVERFRDRHAAQPGHRLAEDRAKRS